MAWTYTPSPVVDQFFGVEDFQALYDSCQFLWDQLGVRHTDETFLNHDDRNIPLAAGVIRYSGEFGNGGEWTVEDGVGFTVADLPGRGIEGRGKIQLRNPMANATWAPHFTPFPTDASADAAEDATIVKPWIIQWYTRTRVSCLFTCRFLNAGATAWDEKSDGCVFSFVARGQI